MAYSVKLGKVDQINRIVRINKINRVSRINGINRIDGFKSNQQKFNTCTPF